jgi:hypothetical protein
MVFGLDMRFLGGNRRKKNNSKNKGNGFSRFAPAFGGAEAPLGATFTACVNACPSDLRMREQVPSNMRREL